MTQEQAGNQIGTRLREWTHEHRTTLMRVAAGIGSGVVAAIALRHHDRLRAVPSEFAAYFNTAKMKTAQQSPLPNQDQAFDLPTLPTQVAELATVQGGGETRNKIALLSADADRLLAQLKNVDGKPAVGWRQRGGEWITGESERTLPVTEQISVDDPNSGIRRSWAAVWLGQHAAEAAIGIAYTVEGDQRLFQPLETRLEHLAYQWEASGGKLQDVHIIRPIAPPGNGNVE